MASVDRQQADFQYAVVEDAQLEHYTGTGWEFVKLIEVTGTEMLHRVKLEADSSGSNYGYNGEQRLPTGNFIRWSSTRSLVRRPRGAMAHEQRIAELELELKGIAAAHDNSLKSLAEVTDKHEKLRANLDAELKSHAQTQTTLKEKVRELNKLKKDFDTVELDIGKREMDRILGRFTEPTTTSFVLEEPKS